MNTRIADAVAAVLCCGDHILVVTRAVALTAFPGYTAFPGGKVEADEAPPPVGPAWCGMDAAHAAALVRELCEELDVDLAALDRAGELLSVRPLGQATTPPNQEHRFATWFYRVELRSQPAIKPDPGELADARWVRPAQAAATWERGESLLVRPTLRILGALASDPDCGDLGDLVPERAGGGLITAEPVCGLRVMPVPSNTLPPADNTNLFILGDEPGERIVVDPSPRDASLCDEVCAALAEHAPRAVFLTHHHPDHRQFADRVARHFGIPIWLSADCRARIMARDGAAFFDCLETRDIAEGDELCRSCGQPVRAWAVPGHDAGHLALAPDDMSWMIVGDLFQGVGTVVIGQPEGNMADYFASLQRVIDLDPRVVVPSHGIAMGSTWRIQVTLAHRRMREDEILRLHQQGQSVDQMLPVIYTGLDERLLPLARMNIEAHLDKLRAEERL